MACERCTPLINAPQEDRERAELSEGFEILEETQDKYDSGTLWQFGTARCNGCQQKLRFSYMQGGQNTGFVAVTP